MSTLNSLSGENYRPSVTFTNFPQTKSVSAISRKSQLINAISQIEMKESWPLCNNLSLSNFVTTTSILCARKIIDLHDPVYFRRQCCHSLAPCSRSSAVNIDEESAMRAQELTSLLSDMNSVLQAQLERDP